MQNVPAAQTRDSEFITYAETGLRAINEVWGVRSLMIEQLLQAKTNLRDISDDSMRWLPSQ
jgi:hypothetical protein